MLVTGTIAAISSAVGPAARMIVRMSGDQAIAIAHTMVEALPPAGEARRMTLRFSDLEVPAWIYCFKAPRSYTAEDLIEFHIPGNPLLARMLLDSLIAAGARHAEAGEFTARAYFAGKLDLAEAEGVAATIGAHSEQELRAARQLLGGELARRLQPATELLVETLALVEAGIDFSEEDISFVAADELDRRLGAIDGMLDNLVRDSSRFEPLTHEPSFVLVGRPNAGKSTLINALAGRDRAVVSPIEGTTRDVLSAEIKLRRGMVRVMDVAGLDESVHTSADGDIARQMNDRAMQAMATADFVVLLRDVTDDRPQLALSRPADLEVMTKSDLRPQGHIDGLCVSAVKGKGIDALRDRLDALAFGGAAASASLALNSRHLQAIAEAREALARSRSLTRGAPELVASELREALDALGQVLGQVTPDDVLGRIFSAFCIGK
jgi:tRNA modification GTPase